MNREVLKFCILNTLLALGAFFVLQKSHLLPGDSNKLFYMGPVIKHKIAPYDSKTLAKDFLVIDTSYDKVLVDHYEYKGQRRIRKGTIAITDREKLLHFFERLNQVKSYNYIVCNLVFDQSSSLDNALAKEMLKIKKMVVSQGKDTFKIRPPFKKLNFGLDAVYVPSGTISKYRIFERNEENMQKSIPLLMAETVASRNIKPGYFVSGFDGKQAFNDFTIEKFIDSDDLPFSDLGFLSDMPLEKFQKSVTNKILIIDDFKQNTKKTIYGNKTPVALILANTYLSIIKGRITISIGLFVFLTAVFGFFSYLVIMPQSKIRTGIFNWPIMGSLLGGTKYVLAMALISLIMYFVFGNNINLVYMGLFFYIENLVIHRKFHGKRMRKRLNIDT